MIIGFSCFGMSPNARARRARTLRSNNADAAAAMKISIQSLLDGARNASGAVAVIDTFRAFTTAAVALANGASRIIMVGTVEEALALRAAESGAICMGEVGAEATVRALLSNSPDQITLVPMGDNGITRTDEDELTAIHLRNRLEGRPGDRQAVQRVILAGGEVRRFYDPARVGHRPEDVEIALDIDRYDFAIRVDCDSARPIARMERPA